MKQPIANVSGTELSVCVDIAARQQIGLMRYGTSVADNPQELRDWLQEAYEETLDKAVYLKRAIAELDKKAGKICRCGNAAQLPVHTCPYAVDINDDTKTLCNCCADCERDCAMNI